MDELPDRTLVRLFQREHGECLYADEDGESIVYFFDSDDEMLHLNAVWAVHRLVRDNVHYVLFQSATYGRYLFVDIVDGDHRVGQCSYDSAAQLNVLFQARSTEDGTSDVFLSNPVVGDWYGEPGDDHDEDEEPLHWIVDAIPPRQFPPQLPPPPEPIPPPPVQFDGPVVLRRRRAGPATVVLAVPPQPVLRRRINYVWAGDQGNFNPLNWRVLQHQFEGRSVYNLRRDIAAELGGGNITLCVSGGVNGRWTPLFIDLPPDENAMNIVVLTTGSAAAQELVYPHPDWYQVLGI